jgi:uncharacterized protein YuzE
MEGLAMSKYLLNVDAIAKAAYIKVSEGQHASTRELSPSVNLDVSDSGELLGVEFLSLSALGEVSTKNLQEFMTEVDAGELHDFIEESRLLLAI